MAKTPMTENVFTACTWLLSLTCSCEICKNSSTPVKRRVTLFQEIILLHRMCDKRNYHRHTEDVRKFFQSTLDHFLDTRYIVVP